MIDNEELLFVVDEKNKPLTPRPRSEVHQQGYWHRTAHVWIVNQQKNILCQKRSLLKDSSPGKWEAFSGGHLGPKMSYIEGAMSEVKEELGIDLEPEKLHQFTLYRKEIGHEFQAVFLYVWNGKVEQLHIEKEEIDEVRWISLEKVAEIVAEKNPQWSLMGYEQNILEHIRTAVL